jgi:hypothetical protein
MGSKTTLNTGSRRHVNNSRDACNSSDANNIRDVDSIMNYNYSNRRGNSSTRETGTSGDANSRDARTDGNTISRRDVNTVGMPTTAGM